MREFEFTAESFGEKTTLVSIGGEVGTCPSMQRLRAQVSERVEAGDIHLILDLEKVKHIDSAGLGFLMLLNGIVDGASGLMVLHHPTSHVAKVIDFTRMEMVIKLAGTLDEAKRLIADRG